MRTTSLARHPSEHPAWLVDLDGTLYRATPLRIFMALELLCSGWGAIGTLRQFRRQHEQLRSRAEPTAISPFQSQLEMAAADLKVPLAHVEQIVGYWMQTRAGKWLRWCRRQWLVRALSGFRLEGGKTAIVSDYPAREKLAALGVGKLFDAVISSGEHPELKRLKPWPDGYLLAAQTLGVPPSECLVIGDRDDTDGDAAQSAGMHFVHVQDLPRYLQAPRRQLPQPVAAN